MEDYEIIFVNDGSKDNSLQILNSYVKRYPDKVKIIDIDNGGQGRARNFALEVAEGYYIGFADSDDWVDSRMFPSLIETAEKNDADIVVCDSYRVEGDRYYTETADFGNKPYKAAGSVWNKLFKKSIISSVRFPEGLWYEDFSFSAKLLHSAEKVVYLPKALYYYRSGQPSTMRNQNSLKNLDALTIIDDIRAYTHDENREETEYFVLNHILLDSIKRVNLQKSDNKKQVISQMREYVRKAVPDLNKSNAFKAESRNRRLVMALNYYGLEDVSQMLLKLKQK